MTKPLSVALLGTFSRRVATLIVLGALVMPPAGIGLDLCWFHAHTGLPCPGCGITRSFASLAHLDPLRAASLHPFGPPLFAVLVLIALSNLLGTRGRAPLERWLDRHQAAIRRVQGVFLAGFLAFGFLRLAIAIVHPEALAAGLLTPPRITP